MDATVFDAIANFGGIVVLAGALLGGIVITKGAHQSVMVERDRADTIRDARLEDQKTVNKELTTALMNTSDALKRLADAWEARNRAEGVKDTLT